MTQEETRKEKLARLLAENKLKRERNEMIRKYKDKLNYQLTIDNFLEPNYSSTIAASVYRKTSTLQSQRFADYQNALKTLKNIKERSSALKERTVVFYYLRLVFSKVGGIVLPLQDVWDILENANDKLQLDIIIVEINFSFGICLEVEEHDYFLTSWGL